MKCTKEYRAEKCGTFFDEKKLHKNREAVHTV